MLSTFQVSKELLKFCKIAVAYLTEKHREVKVSQCLSGILESFSFKNAFYKNSFSDRTPLMTVSVTLKVRLKASAYD